jgi:hypothetical protein
MKTHERTQTNEPTADDDRWLDQYPLEVLEAVLTILKAQRGKASVDHPPGSSPRGS